MTPKEKSIELRAKFIGSSIYITDGLAIKLAIVTVDEIINSIPLYPNHVEEYWNEVKKELEKS